MEDLLPKIASINILITKEINMLKIFTSAALAVLMATAAYSMEDASSSLPVDGSTTVVTGGATGYSEPVAGEVAAPRAAWETSNEPRIISAYIEEVTGRKGQNKFPEKSVLEAQFNAALTHGEIYTKEESDLLTRTDNLWVKLDLSVLAKELRTEKLRVGTFCCVTERAVV